MRIVVLILAILGALSCGLMAFIWNSALADPKVQLGLEFAKSMPNDPKAKEAVAAYNKGKYAIYTMFGGLAMGIVGTVLILLRKELIAAPLMLICPIIGMLVVPELNGVIIVLMSIPIIAAVFAVLFRKKPTSA